MVFRDNFLTKRCYYQTEIFAGLVICVLVTSLFSFSRAVNFFSHTHSSLHSSILEKNTDVHQQIQTFIGVRAEAATGAAAPPNFGQLRFFGQQEKIWAKPGFKDVSLFFYCYFEEINILYFILTKILTSVGVIIKLHSLQT